MADQSQEQLTRAQYDKLAEELAELEGPRRKAIVEAIAVARAHGDLSENFEYHAAKNEQGLLERRITILRHRLQNAEVIDFNRFGNVHLNVRPADLAAAGLDAERMIAIEAMTGSAEAKRGSTYADFEAGEYGVLWDPRGWLTIVRGNPASALDGLGLTLAAPVWLTRAGDARVG